MLLKQLWVKLQNFTHGFEANYLTTEGSFPEIIDSMPEYMD